MWYVTTTRPALQSGVTGMVTTTVYLADLNQVHARLVDQGARPDRILSAEGSIQRDVIGGVWSWGLADRETVATASVLPRAATVRRAAKAAGLGDAITRVTTGSKMTAISARPGMAEMVAAALRPLWSDGEERVRVILDGVYIEQAGVTSTRPVAA